MINIDKLYTLIRYQDSLTDGYLPQERWRVEAEAADPEVFTFTSKESYLEWVKGWKDQYRELSALIRTTKQARKTSLPTYDFYAVSKLWPLKRQANALLWVRKEAKKRSWDQKLMTLTT